VATRERPQVAREPLDETDVDRAIADEEAPDEAAAWASSLPSEPAADDAHGPTTEDLERELEDGTAGPEEQALHPEDTTTEILDDERDVPDGDARGDVGDEIEWRLATRQKGA
jgi:hypothetical protein